MDWIRFEFEHPHSQNLRTEEFAPSSPSSGSGDDPSFTVRRSFGKSIVAPVQPLLPPQLRFPKPRTYWTA